MDTKELICTEVWGGNGAIHREVRIPGLRGVLVSRAAGGERGGDVYYLSACSAGVFSQVCLADVVGHGDQVARVGGWFHETLRRRMNQHDPAAVFGDVNMQVVDRGLDALTTAAAMIYNAKSGNLLYSYAGHPPALIWSPKGGWRRLAMPEAAHDGPRNTPLGVSRRIDFDVAEGFLEPGDRLFLYSDGLVELPAAAGNGRLGEDGLLDILGATPELDVAPAAETVGRGIQDYAGEGAFRHDDITFMLLEAQERVTAPMMWVMMRNRVKKWTQANKR